MGKKSKRKRKNKKRSKKKSDKKVTNDIIPENNVYTDGPSVQNRVYINLTKYSEWINTVFLKDFTNNLENINEAFRHFSFILKNLLGYIEENGNDILANNIRHCHPLKDKARRKAVKIIRETYNTDKLLDDDSNLWQMAMPGEEIRIIGVFVEKDFFPLFIDHHHLLYPSDFYNQPDYNKYKFKPQIEINKKS